jgi:uncharacterized protein YoxC
MPNDLIDDMNNPSVQNTPKVRSRKRNLSASPASDVKKVKINSHSDSPICDNQQSDSNDTDETELKKPVGRRVGKGKRNNVTSKSRISPKGVNNKLKSSKSATIVQCEVKKLKAKSTIDKQTSKPDKILNEQLNPELSNTVISIPEDCVDLVGVLNKIADGMNSMSLTMNKMHRQMNDKIEQVASTVEQKLSNKFSQLLDKRFNAERPKIKEETKKAVKEVKDEFDNDLKELQSQINDIANRTEELTSYDNRALNICVRNHPQRENEDVKQLVYDLIHEGLRMQNIEIKSAERKSRSDNKPGVIIFKCSDREDHDRILKEKSKLKDIMKYEKVYLCADEPVEVRINNSNLKCLISSIGLKGLKFRGSRLVEESNNVDGDNIQTDEKNSRQYRNRERMNNRSRGGGNNIGSGNGSYDRHGGHGDHGRGYGGRDHGDRQGGYNDHIDRWGGYSDYSVTRSGYDYSDKQRGSRGNRDRQGGQREYRDDNQWGRRDYQNRQGGQCEYHDRKSEEYRDGQEDRSYRRSSRFNRNAVY